MCISDINYKNIKGFSLIELAIVLFVVGLMLGGLLTPLATKVEFDNRNETTENMDEIKDILLGFAMVNGYLPCPDCRDDQGNCAGIGSTLRNDGGEDLITAASGVPGLTCASDVGNLPWTTLGVSEADAWGNHYTYRVDSEFADRNDSANTDGKSSDTCTPTANISFSLCSSGDITVLDGYGSSTIIANNIPAIIVSHGSNAVETPTNHEGENYDDSTVFASDTPKTFVKKGYSKDATEGFDDIVVWLSPHILRSKMVAAGILP